MEIVTTKWELEGPEDMDGFPNWDAMTVQFFYVRINVFVVPVSFSEKTIHVHQRDPLLELVAAVSRWMFSVPDLLQVF